MTTRIDDAMRERPILFSAPMVRAILAGTKTVTRRVVWGQPEDVDVSPKYAPHTWGFYGGDGWPAHGRVVRCPYGAPGDRLWVRETWAALGANRRPPFVYRADTDGERVRVDAPWIPSIHMPRAASRILLDVVDARVERLHEITEDDARAEGVERARHYDEADHREAERGNGYQPPLESSVSAFERLWDAINGKRAPWASNPWVWRVEFRRCSDA